MQNLTDFRPWSLDSDDLGGKVVLVVERESVFGKFAWTMLLVKTIKLGRRVRIISLNHSRAHYIAIFRKYGLDLNELEARGELQLFILASGDTVDESTWLRLSEFTVGNADARTAVCIDSTDVLDLISQDPKTSRRLIADCCSLIYESKVQDIRYLDVSS